MATETRFAEQSLLVKLKISEWSATKTDNKATSEVITSHNANGNAGKFQKKLIISSALSMFKNNAQSARMRHYSMTLPWLDEGLRILPTKLYRKYMEAMQEYIHKADVYANQFCDEYAKCVEDAKTHLGTLYDAKDYPPVDRIRSKFDLSIEPRPVPQAQDWRVDLDKGLLEQIQEQTRDGIIAANKLALKDLYDRVYVKVEHLSAMLNDEDRILQHRLIDTMREVTDIIPDLNFMEDANLNQIVEDISKTLTTIDINEMRKDATARKLAAKDADNVLERIAQYTSNL